MAGCPPRDPTYPRLGGVGPCPSEAITESNSLSASGSTMEQWVFCAAAPARTPQTRELRPEFWTPTRRWGA
eukprot:5336903-Pyramimonas_sp.AAC.1